MTTNTKCRTPEEVLHILFKEFDQIAQIHATRTAPQEQSVHLTVSTASVDRLDQPVTSFNSADRLVIEQPDGDETRWQFSAVATRSGPKHDMVPGTAVYQHNGDSVDVSISEGVERLQTLLNDTN